MIEMQGKTVVVTGGSRGIGAAATRALVGVGARVVIHYGRNRAAAETLAASLPEGRCHLVAGDLADAATTEAVWKDALAWQGRIDVLVCVCLTGMRVACRLHDAVRV